MGTEMQEFTKRINELEKNKDYNEALEVVKDLMLKMVQRSSLGRAMDRAIKENVDAETTAKIYREALRGSVEGDEFFEEERSFYLFLVGDK